MRDPRIRLATQRDLPVLRDIERAAGNVFAAWGMASVAADAPMTIEQLTEFQRDGRAWVWTAPGQRPVAYLVAAFVDGNAHVEQVSVHPDYARRGVGRSLLTHVMDWARERGCAAVTLTTYTEVPWNGPYYQRCGFRYLDDRELTDGLRSIRAAEASHGLDRWPRACLRADL